MSSLSSQIAKALEDPKNEPLNWLLGNSLGRYEEVPEGHLLLKLLAVRRTNALVAWNARIYRFRQLLTNPDEAPSKAFGDCKSDGTDIDAKLRGVAGEIEAVLHLGTLGFSDFQVVTAGSSASPDFLALFEGERARIEVKNLREPKDYIRMIAVEQWKKRTLERPDNYRFTVHLRHTHRGPLTEPAERRLRTIIDQLPRVGRKKSEVLDGEVEVSFEKIPHGGDHFVAESGQLVVVSRITNEHFDFMLSELQALFLKCIRVVASAPEKFFGKETSDLCRLNVFALRWEPPEPFYDPSLIEEVQSQIEKLYAAFSLQLKVIIFAAERLDVPLELLEKFE